MKNNNGNRTHAIYECLSCLPEKMISVHGAKNLSEFLLHELANESVFNLEKAAYFVDNPDFNTFKGVAGYNKNERCTQLADIWNKPEVFTDYMAKAKFNNIVRGISRPSLKSSNANESEIVKEISGYLGLKNPKYYTWNMKHDNHGILIVEHSEAGSESDKEFQDHVRRGACLLGFCPVR